MSFVFVLVLAGCLEGEEPPAGETGETGDTAEGDTAAEPVPSPYANCVTTSEYDDFADGTIDARWYVHFDDNGAVTRQDTEMLADGIINSVLAYTNDDQGHPLELRTDAEADGTPDVIDAWTWNDDGTMATWTQDETADGTFDSLVTYTYDGGFLQRRDHDADLDGLVDHAVTITWTHGDTHVGEYLSDQGLDGTIDFRAVETYADEGPMLSQGVDWEADGVIDLVYEYVYDADWALERLQYQGYADGVAGPLEVYTYTYDAAGRESQIAFDIGDDGMLEGIMTSSHVCP